MTSVPAAEKRLVFSHPTVESLHDVTNWQNIGSGILNAAQSEQLNWASADLNAINQTHRTVRAERMARSDLRMARETLESNGRDASHATRLGFERGLVVPTSQMLNTHFDGRTRYIVELLSRGVTFPKIARELHLQSNAAEELASEVYSQFDTDSHPHIVRLAFQSGMLLPDIYLTPPAEYDPKARRLTTTGARQIDYVTATLRDEKRVGSRALILTSGDQESATTARTIASHLGLPGIRSLMLRNAEMNPRIVGNLRQYLEQSAQEATGEHLPYDNLLLIGVAQPDFIADTQATREKPAIHAGLVYAARSDWGHIYHSPGALKYTLRHRRAFQ